MSADSEPEVEGELVKDQILISNKETQKILEQKGYGEISKKKFFLKPFESLYLLYCNKLKLNKGGKIIDFTSLMQTCIKHNEDALTKFLIFRDLRSSHAHCEVRERHRHVDRRSVCLGRD